jgi:saxitoxin biosynthesis operon SxtJ-like protein
MKSRTPRNEQRSFGISVGIVLCMIAALLWWRGRPVRAEVVGGIGVFLLAAGLIYAPILKYPSAAWWRFSRVLGHFNARVLLTLLFSLVLVPVSIVWRITGKDPLARRRDTRRGWSPYPSRYRNPKHYERMF